MFAGVVRCVSDEQVRHRQRRKDADTTQTAWTKFRETVCTCLPNQQQILEKWDPRFYPGVFVGMLNSSSEVLVVTEQGSAIKTRAAKSGEFLSRRDETRTEYSE